MRLNTTQFDRDAIATIRGLAMDAPAAANSGHQGTAMALAPLAHVLYTRVMRYDPTDPSWVDRDRLILSAGHASILLYAMLHLTGQGLSLDDLRAFRQLGSATPGHPEFGHTAGVETTTGPLGQGLATAVGFALAERSLRATYGHDLINHTTWVIAGDGCLEEGISHEAASLAGHQQLSNLVVIYDDNRITIDGQTNLANSTDEAARFAAYGWNVIHAGDIGEDLDALEDVLNEARDEVNRPTLVVLRTHVGFPSPDWTDSPKAHGLAFGAEHIARTKAIIGLPVDETFTVLPGVIDGYVEATARGRAAAAAWRTVAEREGAELLEQLARPMGGGPRPVPDGAVGASIATRNALKTCLNAWAGSAPGLVAGSADLTENTGVALSGAEPLSPTTPNGRQIYFGIREHAMGAVMNGMALHGGFLPIGGTFFVFSDYLRPAIRIAALTGARVIYSFTHDSIGVGEDGPTHQPIEHLASLRAMPGLTVIRPADAVETAGALDLAMDANGPTALCLSRQNLPVLPGTRADGVRLGGYVVNDEVTNPAIVLVGTGSEVALCVEAAAQLASDGISARVVSMPDLGAFLRRSRADRESVLPHGVPVVSIEAGATFGWSAIADVALGIDRFGMSAPAPEAFHALGITTQHLITTVHSVLNERGSA